MDSLQMIFSMLQMQQRLNDQTCGLNWENGYTKEGKIINWKRCIYMECAELIDSFAWKHWKNIKAPLNLDNAVIEIVDIWHFVMSLMLENYKINLGEDAIKLAKDICAVSGFNDFCKEPFALDENSQYEIINDIEALIHKCSGFDSKISDILTNYFRISLKCGVNLSVLYQFYVGKNVLNKFRQDNGYKQGSYKKIWNGKEDNEMVSEILANGAKEPDEIYNKLCEIYNKLNG